VRCEMTIYQVLNEENQLYSEYTDHDKAIYSAQDFTVWDDEHYYHVEELELEVV
jgi:hypothetical protein